MFNKQEAALLKQQFWTSFGQYMAPIPSAEGSRINWINYKTGVKDIQFKLQVDNKEALIGIVLTHTDAMMQAAVYNQLFALRHLLSHALHEDWQWQLQVTDEHNKMIRRIYKTLTGVNIYRQQDWPAIISFFKPRLMALDTFWSEVKFGFEK